MNYEVKEEIKMSIRFMLNETSYFGSGAREKLVPEFW